MTWPKILKNRAAVFATTNLIIIIYIHNTFCPCLTETVHMFTAVKQTMIKGKFILD